MARKCYKVIPPRGILIAGGGRFKNKRNALALQKRIRGSKIKTLNC